MKITWEKQDLKCGKIVACNNGAAEKWMIGYTFKSEGKHWTLNSLSDGLVNVFLDDESIISALNERYIPIELAAIAKAKEGQ